jgi:hypothetical protein
MVSNRASGLQKQLDPGQYCFVKNDGTITGPAPISSMRRDHGVRQ